MIWLYVVIVLYVAFVLTVNFLVFENYNHKWYEHVLWSIPFVVATMFIIEIITDWKGRQKRKRSEDK